MADIGSSLITAGGSFLNGLLGFGQAKKNFKYQKQLAEQQYNYQIQLLDKENAFNLDMFNRANAYNDPSAQRARLENAGFNPVVGMGDTGTAQQMASANPSFSSPSVPNALDISGLGSSAIESFVALKNMFADLRKKEAETKKAQQDTEKSAQETKYQEILNKWADLSEKERIDLLKTQVEDVASSRDLKYSQKKQIDEAIPYIAKLSRAQLDEINAKITNLDMQTITETWKQRNLSASTFNLFAQASLAQLQGQTEKARKLLVEAQTESEKSGKRLTDQQTQQMFQSTQKTYQESVYQAVKNAFAKKGIILDGGAVNNIMNYLWNSVDDVLDFIPNPELPESPAQHEEDGSTSALEDRVDTNMMKLLSHFSGSTHAKYHRNLNFYSPLT